MRESLGTAPIVDFDGTMARLPVDWMALRRALGVERIDHLWPRGDAKAWRVVEHAELRAAERAPGVASVMADLERVDGFAILTSNAEVAVSRFLERFDAVRQKLRRIVGRETLAGPKETWEVFARGFDACVEATANARGNGPIVYIGDAPYELEFARRLGAVVVDVRDYERAGNAS